MSYFTASPVTSLQKDDLLLGCLELGSLVSHPHDRRQGRQEGVLIQPGWVSSRIWYALLGSP